MKIGIIKRKLLLHVPRKKVSNVWPMMFIMPEIQILTGNFKEIFLLRSWTMPAEAPWEKNSPTETK